LIKKDLSEEAYKYINNRLKIRNIHSRKHIGKKKSWSNKDLKLLKEFSKSGMSNIEISHKLNRGTQAIANKISRLKIKRRLYVA